MLSAPVGWVTSLGDPFRKVLNGDLLHPLTLESVVFPRCTCFLTPPAASRLSAEAVALLLKMTKALAAADSST